MLLRLVAVLGLLALSQTALSDERAPVSGSVRGDMRRVYSSFKQLHPYMYNREEFEAPKNQERIESLLKELSAGFTHAGATGAAHKNDPGFATTLRITNDLINDARNRFKENNKGYALFRLRTAANHCVTCHSRYQVPGDFSDTDVELKELNSFQRGEFLMATRQFEKARSEFRAAALNKDLSELEKFKALRNWLVIAVRVKPDPRKAAKELEGIREKADLLVSERYELNDWIVSLNAWAESSEPKLGQVEQAEGLIRQSMTFDDFFSPRRGNVEMLRATSLLHQYLDSGSKSAQPKRAHALYLLGLAYSELPLFFIDGLAESFLELCIRENPNTAEARNAYRLYANIVTLAFTGSGGTNIPDDEKMKLEDLDRISRGVPQVPSQG